MTIVAKIDEVMESKGLTVDQLVEKTGLSRMTIFNAKRGANLSLKTAYLLAEALGVPVGEIWTTEENNADISAA